MSNVNILQVEGGEVTTLNNTDALEVDTGTQSVYIKVPNLADQIGSRISVSNTVRTRYIITPSVASNNLTVALKYIDGNDPSATHSLTFRVGDTEYTLTAAMSFTKNAGTNWCNAGGAELAAKDIDYFVYAIGETGASAGLKFGFSRIPYALTMGDFVSTTTDEKYIAGNWTNLNATDPVTPIGRFRAQLSASASYNWSIPASVVVNYPIFETGILTWTPAYSASASMTYTSVTTDLAEYQVTGRRVNFELEAHGTTGGTANISISATAPFECKNVAMQPAITSWVLDTGSAGISSFAYLDAGTPDKITFRRYDSANWGLGAGRYINGNGKYSI